MDKTTKSRSNRRVLMTVALGTASAEVPAIREFLTRNCCFMSSAFWFRKTHLAVPPDTRYFGSVLGLMFVVFGCVYAPHSEAAISQRFYRDGLDKLWQDFKLSPELSVESGRFPWQTCFESAAKKHQLPLPLLIAIGRGESDFDPLIESKARAHGVMQIQWPGTAKDLGITSIEQLRDPCTNIEAGARYFRGLVKRFKGDFHKAVASYNYGPTRIAREPVLPNGAVLYSGYIYDHLQFVLKFARAETAGEVVASADTSLLKKVTYEQLKAIVVLRSNSQKTALKLAKHYNKQFPGVHFDWMKGPPGLFDVVFHYATEADRASIVARLAKDYITVRGPKAKPWQLK